MLESTFELIGIAAFNSHMVFCLFNLIIAVLVVGSSKSNVQNIVNYQNSVPLPEKVVDAHVEDARAEKGDGDEDGEDLKKRVEEFIQKMNKGWREEKVKTYTCFLEDFEVHAV